MRFFECSFASPARQKLTIFRQWTSKNISDRQQGAQFWKSKKVHNHSTLLPRCYPPPWCACCSACMAWFALSTVSVARWLSNNRETEDQWEHRRRIKSEAKAKVVASAWGEEFIQFLASLAILPRIILKNMMNSSFSFKSFWCNSSYSSNRSVQNN